MMMKDDSDQIYYPESTYSINPSKNSQERIKIVLNRMRGYGECDKDVYIECYNQIYSKNY